MTNRPDKRSTTARRSDRVVKQPSRSADRGVVDSVVDRTWLFRALDVRFWPSLVLLSEIISLDNPDHTITLSRDHWLNRLNLPRWKQRQLLDQLADLEFIDYDKEPPDGDNWRIVLDPAKLARLHALDLDHHPPK